MMQIREALRLLVRLRQQLRQKDVQVQVVLMVQNDTDRCTNIGLWGSHRLVLPWEQGLCNLRHVRMALGLPTRVYLRIIPI